MKNIKDKVFSNASVRDADKKLIVSGMPSHSLMEYAASLCSQYIKQNFQLKSNVLIICGKGNNAGDGYAIARHLKENFNISVFKVYEPKTDDCILNHKLIINDRKIKTIKDLKKIKDLDFDIVIDCVFGTGFKGEFDEICFDLFDIVKNIPCFKIAIDIPSGLSGDTGVASINTFKADLTLAVGAFKKCYYTLDGIFFCGNIIKKDIGIKPENENSYELFDVDRFKTYDTEGIYHKGMSGKVGIISGSYEYTGAPILCSEAALRSGAGLVYLFVPEEIEKIRYNLKKEIIVKTVKKNNICDEIDFFNKELDTLLIGPGISDEYGREEIINIIKKTKNINVILDADVFRILSPQDLLNTENNIIITPHLKEFSLFIGESLDNVKKNIFYFFEKFIEDFKNIYIVLKKPCTFTAYDKDRYIVDIECSSLAKGGSGDVLSGMIAGSIFRYKDIMDCINSNVFIHAYTACRLSEEKFSSSVLPSDIVEEYGRIVNELRR